MFLQLPLPAVVVVAAIAGIRCCIEASMLAVIVIVMFVVYAVMTTTSLLTFVTTVSSIVAIENCGCSCCLTFHSYSISTDCCTCRA